MSRALVALVVLVGCGKKTPPVVAEAAPAAAPAETTRPESADTASRLDLRALDPQPEAATVALGFGWEDGMEAHVEHEVVARQITGDMMSSMTTTKAMWVESFVGSKDGHRYAARDGEGGTRIEPPPSGADAMETVMTALTLATVETVVDDAGTFVAIDGLDGVKSDVAARVAPVMDALPGPLQQVLRDTLAQGLQPDVVEGDAKNRWDALVGDWVGKTLDVGVPVEEADGRGRPVTTTVLGWVPCKSDLTERECVVIQRVTRANEEEVGRSVQQVELAVAAAWPTGTESPELVESELATTETLVTLPGTLMPFAYAKRKTTSHSFRLGDRIIPWGSDLRSETWWSWHAMGRP